MNRTVLQSIQSEEHANQLGKEVIEMAGSLAGRLYQERLDLVSEFEGQVLEGLKPNGMTPEGYKFPENQWNYHQGVRDGIAQCLLIFQDQREFLLHAFHQMDADRRTKMRELQKDLSRRTNGHIETKEAENVS